MSLALHLSTDHNESLGVLLCKKFQPSQIENDFLEGLGFLKGDGT